MLRVGNESDWPPFDFFLYGEPSGYGIDLIRRLADGLGVELEFVSGPSWPQLLAMLASGEIDLLPAVYKTPARREVYLFSRAYLDTQLVVVSREGQDTPVGLEWLNDRLVGVQAGDGAVLSVEQRLPGSELKFYTNYLDALLALSSGELDAVVGNSLPTYYLANQNQIFNLRVLDYIRKQPREDYSTALHFAINAELGPLVDILNLALDALPSEDWSRLDQRWFRNLIAVEHEAGVPLTRAERTYLDQKGRLRLCVSPDWLPYERYSAARGHEGIGAELSRELGEKLGVELEVYPTDTRADSLASIRAGRCDLLTIAMDLPSRRDFLRFSQPYSEQPFVIAARRDAPYVWKLDELGSADTVGAMIGSAQMELLRTEYGNVRIDPVANAREGLRRVQSGELFGYIDSLATIGYEVQRSGLFDIKVAGTLKEPLVLSVATRRDAPLLASAVDKALSAIGPNELDRIVNRWLSVPFESEPNYTLALQVILGAAALLVGLYAWNRRLARTNRALAAAQQELAQKTHELARLSVTDSLTQLNNRLKLDVALTEEIERSRRTEAPLSAVLLDIDHFKETNDRHGHQVGDQVLVRIGELLRRLCRRIDIVGRWGGEEFLILCPNTDLNQAAELAERIRAAIHAEDFGEAGSKTASFGVATYRRGDEGPAVVGRADEALYQAKAQGRNRVVTAARSP